MSLEECTSACMDDCECLGFNYRRGSGRCFPKSLLFSGRHSAGANYQMFIKVAADDSSVANVSSLMNSPDSKKCSREFNISASQILPRSRKRSQLILPMVSVVSVIGLAEIVCVALGWWYIYRHDDDALFNRGGYFAIPSEFKRFSFSDLRRATDNFKDVIGKGGFGTVYKGTLLPGNKMVAVKRLEGVFQGEEEFWAEVKVIGTVHHMNLLRMVGFCAERKHRLLVYEYVQNGSLDSYLFSHNEDRRKALDWRKRFQIAVGTAKGLAYLHEECLEWILHCDVKPQNILLDEEFCAKVSDFGLSKLVDRHRERALSFSTIRGTRGYMAPEWTMNLPITAKADVYSFGILLLELASGKNAAEFNVSGGNLVQWAVENVRRQSWMENMVDSTLQAPEIEKPEVERVLKTALLCVEFDKNRRPSMSEVVEMLTSEIIETTTKTSQANMNVR
ncbi:hypothetical protein KI387_039407 [Taxus chinensis]|uniref:non-specific serine/threonine protein kinase n=1 Tax=Taxus chinensis TaxID=29808 RepID=A0AA38CDN3_TAXCH|nr:hypothetical protein KI387_039407 [Taxus chinensis]